jgi:hypothetical protein
MKSLQEEPVSQFVRRNLELNPTIIDDRVTKQAK